MSAFDRFCLYLAILLLPFGLVIAAAVSPTHALIMVASLSVVASFIFILYLWGVKGTGILKT